MIFSMAGKKESFLTHVQEGGEQGRSGRTISSYWPGTRRMYAAKVTPRAALWQKNKSGWPKLFHPARLASSTVTASTKLYHGVTTRSCTKSVLNVVAGGRTKQEKQCTTFLLLFWMTINSKKRKNWKRMENFPKCANKFCWHACF